MLASRHDVTIGLHAHRKQRIAGDPRQGSKNKGIFEDEQIMQV
jgi:hypothetical protein